MLLFLFSVLLTSQANGVDIISSESPSRYNFSDGLVEFNLYTRLHPIRPLAITYDNNTSGWLDSFSRDKETVVVSHGFLGNADSEVCQLIRDAHLHMSDVNVIVVDWSSFTPSLARASYDLAVNATFHVGDLLARLLNYLTSTTPTSASSLHLIGFSLGAHVVGRAGALLRAPARRITGLDPAKPRFEGRGPDKRLDRGDADHVVVVHTETRYVGYKEAMGDVDFYPNGGGMPQPHCKDVGVAVFCSHQAAYRFYVSSVYHPDAFTGVRCLSWTHYLDTRGGCDGGQTTMLGPHSDSSARGSFYLRTADEPPYFLMPLTSETSCAPRMVVAVLSIVTTMAGVSLYNPVF